MNMHTSAAAIAAANNPETVKKRPPLSVRPAPQFPPFAMDKIAASHYCSVGTTVLMEAVNAKKLRMRKLGGKTLFFREDLEEWLRNEAQPSMPVPKRRVDTAAPAAPNGSGGA